MSFRLKGRNLITFLNQKRLATIAHLAKYVIPAVAGMTGRPQCDISEKGFIDLEMELRGSAQLSFSIHIFMRADINQNNILFMNNEFQGNAVARCD